MADSKKFVDATDKVYRRLFSPVSFQLLDTDNTLEDSVFGESPQKVYKTALQIYGRVKIRRKESNDPELDVKEGIYIYVPMKELTDNHISCSSRDDYITLKQGMFTVKGITYQVDEVQPQGLVMNNFMVILFRCSQQVSNVE